MTTIYSISDEASWITAATASQSAPINAVLTNNITLTSAYINGSTTNYLKLGSNNYLDGQKYTVTLDNSITASIGFIQLTATSGNNSIIRNVAFYQPTGQINVSSSSNGLIFGNGTKQNVTIQNCIFRFYSYPITATTGLLFGDLVTNLTLTNVVIQSLNPNSFQVSSTSLIVQTLGGVTTFTSVYCLLSGTSTTSGIISNYITNRLGYISSDTISITDFYVVCTNQTNSSTSANIGIFGAQVGSVTITNAYSVFLNSSSSTYASTTTQGLSLIRQVLGPSSPIITNYYTNYSDSNLYLVKSNPGSIPITATNTNYAYIWGSAPTFSGTTTFATGGTQPYLLSPFTSSPFDGSVYTAYNVVATFTSPTPSNVPCFCRDMEILTPKGYRRVQDLTLNDIVLTPDLRYVPICSIFHSIIRGDEATVPVKIPAHYFDKDRPDKDILVSPHHLIFGNGAWHIPLWLENVDQDMTWLDRDIVYYHIALPDYAKDKLICHNLPVDSWDQKTIRY